MWKRKREEELSKRSRKRIRVTRMGVTIAWSSRDDAYTTNIGTPRAVALADCPLYSNNNNNNIPRYLYRDILAALKCGRRPGQGKLDV